ncbi:MAG: type II secretion system F family protein [Propionibacteriaceae bacterium]
MIGSGLAALAGLLLVGGVVAVAVGLRPTPVTRSAPVPSSLTTRWAWLTRRPPGRRGRRRDLWLAVAVSLGVLVAALSGWFVAILLVPLLLVGLPAILSTPPQREAELLEALDRWVRSLVATLPTGRSIPDAIRLSHRTAPALLTEPLGLLIARLNGRWPTEEALVRFADELDSPDADGVVAALILAANRGSTGATATLAELADSIQAQLRGRREIETERAKPYVVVRQVTVITVITAGVVVVLGRSFFAPYLTVTGQIILTGLVSAYFASLLFMRFRARAVRHDRILLGARP